MKETDMNYVRDIARTLLHVEFSPASMPFIIHHPFTNSNPLCYMDENKNIVFADAFLPEDEPKRQIWRKMMEQEIDESNLVRILNLVNRPYRLYFLYLCRNRLSERDMGSCLAATWSHIEYISTDSNLNSQKIISLFHSADRTTLMSDEEQAYIDSLPDVVTLYRGVTTINRNRKKAMSWTTDRKIAEWFAKRFDSPYKAIWTIQIPKSRILCYFDNGEKECVINLYRYNTDYKVEIL